MKVYLKLDPPFEWVKVNEKALNGSHPVDSFGQVESLDEYVFDDSDEVVGVVSGEFVTEHEVNLPAKSKKLFNAALPYALEESLSEDVDMLHFLTPEWKYGETCRVLVLSKSKMEYWRELTVKFKLPLVRLIPDHSLVPLHEIAQCSISVDDQVVYAKRQVDYGVTLDSDFVDAWIMDTPVDQMIAVNDKGLTEKLITDYPNRDFRYWDFGTKIAHWLAYPVNDSLDLWGDQYRPSIRRSGSSPYLLPLLIMFLVVFGKVGFDLYKTIELRSEMSAIRDEIRMTFLDAQPDLEDIGAGQEKQVMEQLLTRLGGQEQSISMQSMLALAARVLKNQNVTLRSLSFQNDSLTLSCILVDFSQVDKLTKQLNSNKRLSALLQSSEADGAQVIANYLISEKNK